MATVNQPSKMPTRKLGAAVIISALMGWGGIALANLLPDWYDPATWTTTTTLVMALVGYFFVKDAPNA